MTVNWGMLSAAVIIMIITFYCRKNKMIDKSFPIFLMFGVLLIAGGLAGVNGFSYGDKKFELSELKREVNELSLLTREFMAKEAVNNGRFATGKGITEAKEYLKPIYGDKTDSIIKLYVDEGIYKASISEVKSELSRDILPAMREDSFLLRKMENLKNDIETTDLQLK